MSLSPYDRLMMMDDAQRAAFLQQCTPATLRAIVHKAWVVRSRPEQEIPPGKWFLWYLEGGRGSGKTETAAQATKDAAEITKDAAVVVGNKVGEAGNKVAEGAADATKAAADATRQAAENTAQPAPAK